VKGLLTLITDSKSRITKKILNKDLDTTASGHLTDGTGRTIELGLSGLADTVQQLTKHQCLCLGVIPDIDGEYPLKSVGNADGASFTRTADFFEWPDSSAFMLFDIDEDDALQAWDDIIKLDNNLADCQALYIPSVSSHIYDEKTGNLLSKKAKGHIYVLVNNGQRIKEYGAVLYNLSVIAGHAKIKVAKNTGVKLVRTIFDRSVWTSPNREIFEANPICCEGVISKRLEHIKLLNPNGAPYLDLDKAIANNQKIKEQEILASLQISKLKSDKDIEKQSVIERKKGAKLRAKRSKCKTTTLPELRPWFDTDLLAHTTLGSHEIIKDNDGNDILLSDILLNPEDWKNKGIPDPINPYKRGDEKRGRVGRDIARVRYDDTDERVFIFSFYGHIEYDIAWTFQTMRNLILDASSIEEVDNILDILTDQDANQPVALSETELAELARICADKNKTLAKVTNDSSRYGTAVVNLRKEIKNATATKQNTIEESKKKALTEDQEYLLQMNRKYGAVLIGNKARIVYEEYNKELHAWMPNFISIDELKKHYKDDRVPVRKGNEIKYIDKFAAWELHPGRNKYDRIVFKPRNDLFRGCGQPHVIQQGGEYNTWMGYLANLENATTCERILWHIKHIWCSGNKAMYEYTLTWLATLFQNPASIGQPYLVLASAQGTGKNIIVSNVLMRILGIHGIIFTKRGDLTGRFNGHLADKVLGMVNESFFAGDPSDRSFIKTLIDPELYIERKGIERTISRNYMKLIFASNEDWVAGVEAGDRRFVYLPMSDEKKGDTEYFKALSKEIESGGREAFLKYMLEFESEIDLNQMPEGQATQKIEDMISTGPAQIRFIIDLLDCNGNLRNYITDHTEMYSVKRLVTDWKKKDVRTPSGLLHELYKAYCIHNGESLKYLSSRETRKILRDYGLFGTYNDMLTFGREVYPVYAHDQKGNITFQQFRNFKKMAKLGLAREGIDLDALEDETK